METTEGSERSMKVAVASIVVLEVPDGTSLDELRARLYAAHVFAIGDQMVTVTGTPYTLCGIERLEVAPDRGKGRNGCDLRTEF
jgi:hypothetical protein